MFGSQLKCSFRAALLLPFATTISVAQLNYYVSPSGTDTNNGLSASNSSNGVGPVATLTRARDLIRIERQKGNTAAAYVRVRAGTYNFTSSLYLGEQDYKTTYQPYGDGTVRLSGGAYVNSWKTVSDSAILSRLSVDARANVMVANLPGAGVTDYGKIQRRSYFSGASYNSPLELAFKGRTMKVAQYPNNGWVTINGVFNGGASVSFASGTMAKPVSAPDAFAYGYWNYDWADALEPVSSYNVDDGTLTLKNVPPLGTSINGRFRIANVLEELDSPGEYYLDRSTGNLYFWPPSSISTNSCVVSVCEAPVISLYKPVDMNIVGFLIESSRDRGVHIQGGLRTNVLNCFIRNMGREGVTTAYCTTVNISGNDILDMGNGGIWLHGGDSPTLTAGGVNANDNRIQNFGLIERCYRPGIGVNGCSNRASANQISQGPHCAILLSGNNNLVVKNEIYNMCTETGDAGLIYTGRDITCRGNVISYNYLHDSRGTVTRSGQYTQVAGIYLDDFASGFNLYRNTLSNLDIGVVIGGGRNNQVNGQVFYAVGSSVNIDARGKTWGTSFYQAGGTYDQEIAKLGTTAVGLFKTTYADFLSHVTATDKGLPANNMVLGCILPSASSIYYADSSITKPLLGVVSNYANAGSWFAAPANGDFSPASGVTLPFQVTDKSIAGNVTKTARPADILY